MPVIFANNIQKIIFRIVLVSGLLLFTNHVFSQDPDFHIYLCFGQSNMQGQGTIESQDRTVDSRFKVLEAVDCSNLGREKGIWYTAVPPLCRCYSGLSPADYFGRTMVSVLPENISVGVINVSVAGCKIELFDKDNYQDYAATAPDWMKNIINEYGGNPYSRLVEMAKLAQQDGMIKGILLHQGESNTGDKQWPAKVKGVYDNLISDLGLDPDSVPLLAGEVVNADQGGACASMNNIIAKLPQTISNSYVISSSQCTAADDNIHFDSEGYRKFGRRYAIQMLSLLGYEITEVESTEEHFFEAECALKGEDWEVKQNYFASNGNYVEVKSGMTSESSAPDSTGLIQIPFKVDTAANFHLYARVLCPSYTDDSFWIKMDDGKFSSANGLFTGNWQWKDLIKYELTKGGHLLTIGYREDGARLDKVCISNYPGAPEDAGGEAENICDPDSLTSTTLFAAPEGFSLFRNYPNPFRQKTIIAFALPEISRVSLKVYNLLGEEIATLADCKFPKGKHKLEFIPNESLNGNFFYTIKTDKYSATRKMVILK